MPDTGVYDKAPLESGAFLSLGMKSGWDNGTRLCLAEAGRLAGLLELSGLLQRFLWEVGSCFPR